MVQKEAVSSVRIDSELQVIFAHTKSIHNKSLSDACNEGMMLILKDYLPLQLLEKEIESVKQKLSELESSRPYAERFELLYTKELEKQSVVEKSAEIEAIFHDYREALLDPDNKSCILRVMKKGMDPSWDNFYIKAGFKSAKDAKEWYWSEVIKRGLLI